MWAILLAFLFKEQFCKNNFGKSSFLSHFQMIALGHIEFKSLLSFTKILSISLNFHLSYLISEDEHSVIFIVLSFFLFIWFFMFEHLFVLFWNPTLEFSKFTRFLVQSLSWSERNSVILIQMFLLFLLPLIFLIPLWFLKLISSSLIQYVWITVSLLSSLPSTTTHLSSLSDPLFLPFPSEKSWLPRDIKVKWHNKFQQV